MARETTNEGRVGIFLLAGKKRKSETSELFLGDQTHIGMAEKKGGHGVREEGNQSR